MRRAKHLQPRGRRPGRARLDHQPGRRLRRHRRPGSSHGGPVTLRHARIGLDTSLVRIRETSGRCGVGSSQEREEDLRSGRRPPRCVSLCSISEGTAIVSGRFVGNPSLSASATRWATGAILARRRAPRTAAGLAGPTAGPAETCRARHHGPTPPLEAHVPWATRSTWAATQLARLRDRVAGLLREVLDTPLAGRVSDAARLILIAARHALVVATEFPCAAATWARRRWWRRRSDTIPTLARAAVLAGGPVGEFLLALALLALLARGAFLLARRLVNRKRPEGGAERATKRSDQCAPARASGGQETSQTIEAFGVHGVVLVMAGESRADSALCP